jgi:hypothetical protein
MRTLRELAVAGAIRSELDLLAAWRARARTAGQRSVRRRPGPRCGVAVGADVVASAKSSRYAKNPLWLLTRAVAVFAVNTVLGLAASAASGAVASLTFGCLLPMTAICELALAVAVAARSAIVGAAAGVAAWVITVLANQMVPGPASPTPGRTSWPVAAIACALFPGWAPIPAVGRRSPNGPVRRDGRAVVR